MTLKFNKPILVALAGYITLCNLFLELSPAVIPLNPCVPSPCGLNAECRDINGIPSCSCLSSFIGSPPNCRPECTVNSDCSPSQACIREKCRDPCPGSCGVFAQCSVLNHVPICSCMEGYTGDPFTSCTLRPSERKKSAPSPSFIKPLFNILFSIAFSFYTTFRITSSR